MSSSTTTAPTPASLAVVQEFPARGPQALSSEHVSLESLVHHRHTVPHDLPLEQVHRLFRDADVNYAALIRDGMVSGVCSRARLGFLLGSRFGFALDARSPAHTAQVARPLVFARTTPVRRILERALARPGEEFHEDVVLVDEEQHLLGLIPVQALAQLQNRLVGEQLAELRRQHDTLQRQNLELFQTNHAARQAQGLYQGLFESDALGVALLDTQGAVQTHNRRLAELLGLGDTTVELFSLAGWIVERERSRFAALLSAHEREGRVASAGEFHLEVPGRGARLFRISTGWIRETGQICACFDDISEQRTMERHVQRQEKQVLLDTLVGGIAHELNNKLTPVLGFAELLSPIAREPERSYVEYIGKSVLEAGEIIRQLLQLSKPAGGNPQFTDLRQAVDEALVMLKFQLRESRVVTRVVSPPEPTMVHADNGQLKQVVINLALNAIQAMEHSPAPQLEIEVGHEAEQAFIAVRDSGTGIAPEIIGRIFDPFFTTKGPDRGSGLGLSICFSIMRQHGGDLTVESEPGQGARFKALLPAALAIPAVAPVKTETAPVIAGPELPGRKRVLVVEDEDVVRRLMQEMLRTCFAVSVDTAQHGREALGLAEANDYDLIISDIRMPEMNGPDFYLRLKQVRPALARRFFFITGHAGEREQIDDLARWGVSVMAKPFTVARLIEACTPFLGPNARGAVA